MTGRTSRPDAAALGVRAHSGLAAYLVLSGDSMHPDIDARARMTLCDPAIKGSKQPFHEAEPMTFAKAEQFITRCAASTAALAEKALADIQRNSPVSACCVLTASGKPLPDLKGILASHTLIHAAEGEFYRDAVAVACKRQQIAVRRVRERDVEVELHKLPVPVVTAKERLIQFGKQMGPPWTQDEKMAAIGAWLMLALLPTRRRHQ